MRAARLTATLCAAEVLGMAGFSSFAALLPEFLAAWRISGTEAGWIAGIYYAGYMAAVPFLAALTDRIDARLVHMAASALTGLALLAFALLAEGFWSALLLQALAGLGLAGTYMPGLKALSDRVEGPHQSRFIAFYTASFGLGASFSFLLSGAVGAWLGWRAAFAAAALGALAALLLVGFGLKPVPPPAPHGRLLHFRPALRDRAILGFCLAYAAHNFELFGFRAWIVAFLAFAYARQGGAAALLPPTLVATAAVLVGVAASIAGNELALRHGRRRVIALVMGGSALLACLVGFAAALPLLALAGLCLLYAALVSAESAALTAGMVAATAPGRRGAAMALYSGIGFAGAFLGPLAFGLVLDLGGSERPLGWGLAFATLGLGVALGPLALRLGGGRP